MIRGETQRRQAESPSKLPELGLENLDAKSPGIIASQSTHKQLAGFSQAAQIHVRDNHIKGRSRRTEHRRFNEMFMLHCSTSPFYPLFASLDVDAHMQSGRNGLAPWDDTIRIGIETRKKLRALKAKFAAMASKDERKSWFLRSVRARRSNSPDETPLYAFWEPRLGWAHLRDESF